MNSGSPLVEINALSKRFSISKRESVNAVRNVSLTIYRNEVLGLVGESGSGKSTLGQLIMGLHQPSAGGISFEGELLAKKRNRAALIRQASRMQMIFQNPYSSLNARMTVREILAEPLKLARKNPTPQAIERWITKVGLLHEHLNRYPHEFSGGQRQRIAIARGLITEPQFVVCDEPISALDLSVQAQIVNMLGELKRDLGVTLLFIAHDLSMVRYISDRIAVMYQGMIMEVGDANEVYYEPKHPYTRLLLSSILVANPRIERAREQVTLAENVGATERPIDGVTEECCPFFNRCPDADSICQKSPTLKPLANNGDKVDKSTRFIACHRY